MLPIFRFPKVAIIGSGFSGLSAACYLSSFGYQVDVFEKNNSFGGRARQFNTDCGFRFDMGPSWYWMPDVVESFFADFGFSTADFYDLKPLNPQFEIVFDGESIDVPADMQQLRALFESIECGAGKQFDRFMEDAQEKYEIAMSDFIYTPSLSWMEFLTPRMLAASTRLNLLTSFRTYVRKYFKDPRLLALMEFPVIFLGASPRDIPAMYSLMSYGGYGLGTWYPQGGFKSVVDAMVYIAEQKGVNFHLDTTVENIQINDSRAISLNTSQGGIETFDYLVGSSDYKHTESLLPQDYRNYSEQYWSKKTLAPSCLIYYLGFDVKIPNLKHHTLFFEHDMDAHLSTVYDTKEWPESPLFYACCPSKTDAEVAPLGSENLFLLLPLAVGLEDPENIREQYLEMMLSRLEKHTGAIGLKQHLVYKRSYCVSDFQKDYNAFNGNAYGLANTLKQTAVLKPSIRNKKVKNIFYTGQLTVPGPGVPPSIISGKIVAREIQKQNL